jgi:septal ring factor EnvC (AmiA/AmiB activator)
MSAALSTRTSRSLEDVRYDVKRFLREELVRGRFWSGEVSGVTSYIMERAVVRKPCFMLEATQPATTQPTTTERTLTQTATQTDARKQADAKAQISRLKEQLAAAEKSISDAANQKEEAEKHEILIATSLQNMNKHIRRLQEEEISAQSQITFLQSEVLRQQSMAINTQMDYQMMLALHNDFSAPHDAHFFAPHGVDFPVVEIH